MIPIPYYTTTLIILLAVSIFLILKHAGTIDWKLFSLWLATCSLFAWCEFASLNIFDKIPAWQFSPKHILGYYFALMPIEDFLFAPICGAFFYIFYVRSKVFIPLLHIENDNWEPKYDNYTPVRNFSNDTFSRLIAIILIFSLMMFFFNFGNYFGKYSAWKTGIGLICLLYSWENWHTKHFLVTIIFIVLFSALWDIWALNTYQWWYRSLEGYSCAFMKHSWNWFHIWKAWFPIEIFPYYYLNGAVFTFGVLSALEKKMNSFNNRFLKK